MDAAFEKDHTWEHAAKKSWTRPAQNLGDPNKDLILYFQLIPPFIKNDLLNHETAHKRQKELSSPEDFLRCCGGYRICRINHVFLRHKFHHVNNRPYRFDIAWLQNKRRAHL